MYAITNVIISFRSGISAPFKGGHQMDRKHSQLFEQFSTTFQPNTIVSWEKLINAWKKDRSQANPYLEPSPWSSFCYLFYLIAVISHNLTGCVA